jgi:hypothetical protein
MRRCRRTIVALLAGLLASSAALAADPPDLSKVARDIKKEPAYVAKPLYGLYVFGPEARTRVWAILDKSKPDASDYDVLYFDRNANGDLSESNERIAGEGGNFQIGSINDPVTGGTHTEAALVRRLGTNPMVMFEMRWRGKVHVRGGYAEDPGPYTQFAEKPADAPVLWPGAEGPFSFQRWTGGKLSIGAADDMRVFLGHRGHGKNTFCGVPQDFLPAKAAVLATVIYTDKDGKEQRMRSELTERC